MTHVLDAFNFHMLLAGKPVAAFQEVGGVSVDVEDSGPRLVTCKRGVLIDLATWAAFANSGKEPLEALELQLRGEDGRTVASWTLAGATMRKISGPGRPDPTGALSAEEVEFACADVRLAE